MEAAAFRAAQIAQERALEYLRSVSNGEVAADPRKAEALAKACEETFAAWMQACPQFTAH